jgi:outer membrane receptor protein involved in Fe transport
LDFYGATEAIDAARDPFDLPALVDAMQLVPLIFGGNDGPPIPGLPPKSSWEAFTGRAVLDWQLSDDVMFYGSYSRGYKPGGYNAGGVVQRADVDEPVGLRPTYDREDVNSFEVGVKSLLADGSLSLNAAVFFNDYDSLQIADQNIQRVLFGTINSNIDAEMLGAELEARWRPAFAPRAEFELGYSWLDATLKNLDPIEDPLSLTGGDPSFVEMFAWQTGDPGRFVAPIAEVLPLVDAGIAAGAAVGPDRAPAAQYPNGIPAWFEAAFLEANGVDVQFSVPVDISGNRIPEAPEHTVHLAASYTWDVLGGALTARWDYYWQDSAFMSIYNRASHRIGSWDQHNATVVYESGDNRWSVRAWIRNLEDDLHITGGLRSREQSFAASDPRSFGASVRYNFGAM